MDRSNFYAVLARNFLREDGRPCIVDEHGRASLTYSDLDRHSAAIASVLNELGLRRGDRVVAQVDKSAETLMLYLACLRRGVIFVPLNTAYTPAEVTYFLEDADPALFVCRPGRATVQSNRGIRTETLDAAGGGTLIERAAGAQPVAEIADVEPNDVAAILYTSGTTGRSKGAMLTHANLATNAQALTDAWGWRPDDVLLHALPIYHAHGLFVGVHLSLFNGTPMIFLSKFDAGEVLAALPAATVFMGVPTFYTRLLAETGLDRDACANMRLFISGSAPLPADIFRAFDDRTGHQILERYGMTEALMITSNPLDGERCAGSVGYPLPGVQVRVVDDAGNPMPSGETGSLEIAGPNVFAGYWRTPEQTAAEFTGDGFFRTGDLAAIGADGRVTLAGRSKDLIISGGLNVYPSEIEATIDAHASVSESAVVGVPHPDFGEAVVAVVVPAGEELDIEALKAWLSTRLASFKHPKLIVTIDALPRNAMGKVQKNLLREKYADYFTA